MTISVFIPKAGTNVTVDFDKLPEHVKAHIIEYGLKQKLNDVHSAEKNGKVALGLVNNLIERLQAGELTKSRSVGSPIERELRLILIKVAKAKTGKKQAELIELDSEELIALLAKALDKSEEDLLTHFTAKAEAQAEAKAVLAQKSREEDSKLLSGLEDLI